MTRRFFLALFALLLGAPQLLAQAPVEVKVMAFNIRYAHTTPPNLWPDRREALRQTILDSDAEIIGLQEALYPQISDIDWDLPADFEWIGLGREGGSRGEYMAVFYRASRFIPVEYDHFWLSDTPATISSRSWGNNIPRMVTWIRFRERATGREFYFVNTHFDHQSQPSREKSAALVLERIAAFDPQLPIIMTGDFNSEAIRNPAYQALVAPGAFRDTWTESNESEPSFGTFHNFRGPENAAGGARIDWILVKGAVETVDTEIRLDNLNGQYPSDHFPVTATVRLR